MRIKIKNLATVQMGYSFRSRLEGSAEGGVAVIQMKDLGSNNVVTCDDFMKIEMSAVKEHHLVRRGDLVFRSRGHVTTSAILLQDPGPAVVAAPLLRIRISKPDQILPEYLNWYINQRDAQSYLTSRSEGTALKKIGKKELESLEIFLPSIEAQHSIVELAALLAREQSLLRTLARKREQHISATLMQFAKGE